MDNSKCMDDKKAFNDKINKMLKEDTDLSNYVLQSEEDKFFILNPYKKGEKLIVDCHDENIIIYFLDTHIHIDAEELVYYVKQILKERVLSFVICFNEGELCMGGIIDLNYPRSKKRVYKMFKFDNYLKYCKYLYIKSWSGRLDETKNNKFFKIK